MFQSCSFKPRLPGKGLTLASHSSHFALADGLWVSCALVHCVASLLPVQTAGLTKLVSQLTREGNWQKGLEVFECLSVLGVVPDTTITNAASELGLHHSWPFPPSTHTRALSAFPDPHMHDAHAHIHWLLRCGSAHGVYLCVCVCVYASVYVCVCVCACVRVSHSLCM